MPPIWPAVDWTSSLALDAHFTDADLAGPAAATTATFSAPPAVRAVAAAVVAPALASDLTRRSQQKKRAAEEEPFVEHFEVRLVICYCVPVRRKK